MKNLLGDVIQAADFAVRQLRLSRAWFATGNYNVTELVGIADGRIKIMIIHKTNTQIARSCQGCPRVGHSASLLVS